MPTYFTYSKQILTQKTYPIQEHPFVFPWPHLSATHCWNNSCRQHCNMHFVPTHFSKRSLSFWNHDTESSKHTRNYEFPNLYCI